MKYLALTLLLCNISTKKIDFKVSHFPIGVVSQEMYQPELQELKEEGFNAEDKEPESSPEDSANQQDH